LPGAPSAAVDHYEIPVSEDVLLDPRLVWLRCARELQHSSEVLDPVLPTGGGGVVDHGSCAQLGNEVGSVRTAVRTIRR